MAVVTVRLVNYSPPSVNATRSQHWSKVRRHKRRCMDLLKVAYLQEYGCVPRFRGRVRVNIIRRVAGRRKLDDPDNLPGRFKPLIDALRARKYMRVNRHGRPVYEGGIGVFEDDDMDLIHPSFGQERILPEDRQPGVDEELVVSVAGERIT